MLHPVERVVSEDVEEDVELLRDARQFRFVVVDHLVRPELANEIDVSLTADGRYVRAQNLRDLNGEHADAS